MLAAAALALACGAAAEAKRTLPPYPEALRCAALTEAAARQEGLPPKKHSAAFDAAMFWGMAASEAARKAKVSGTAFTADQEREGAIALAQLKADREARKAQLAECLKDVPPLK